MASFTTQNSRLNEICFFIAFEVPRTRLLSVVSFSFYRPISGDFFNARFDIAEKAEGEEITLCSSLCALFIYKQTRKSSLAMASAQAILIISRWS
jgi:hypothetical protein